MAFLNKVGSCNMTGCVDIIANSLSLIKPDGSLQTLTLGGTIAPINSPQFTGTVGGVSKETVGLGNVDNTSDLSKPISAATQNALNTIVLNTNSTLTSHLGLINTDKVNLSNLVVSTNNTFASHLTKINTNTLDITGLITSTNNTFASHLTKINANDLNTTNLITSTNNTFASHLTKINTNDLNTTNLITSTNNTFASHLTKINTNELNTTNL